MLALMKPSSVATRSRTRGTSRGCTVVTETSGAAGPAGGALREHDANDAQISAHKAAIVNNRRLPMEFVSPLNPDARFSEKPAHLQLPDWFMASAESLKKVHQRFGRLLRCFSPVSGCLQG